MFKLRLQKSTKDIHFSVYLNKYLQNLYNKNDCNFPKKTSNLNLNSTTINQIKSYKHSSESQLKHKYVRKYTGNSSVDFLLKIQDLFEGKEITIQTNYELLEMLKISKLLHIHEISYQIEHELQQNFDNYDFFTLFTVSIVCSITWLQNKCLIELKRHKFEQLNYNLYDLLQCDSQIFKQIISIHQQYVTKGVCKGLNQKKLKYIINQYCEANGVCIIPEEILHHSLEIVYEVKEENMGGDEEFMENSSLAELQIHDNEDCCSEEEKTTSPRSQVSELEEDMVNGFSLLFETTKTALIAQQQ